METALTVREVPPVKSPSATAAAIDFEKLSTVKIVSLGRLNSAPIFAAVTETPETFPEMVSRESALAEATVTEF